MTSRAALRLPRSTVPRGGVHRLGRVLAAATAGWISLLGAAPAATGAPGNEEPSPTSTVWPLSPRPEVVAGFDPPTSAWAAGHRGVDLLGSPGRPVRAAVGGTVAYAGLLAGKGVVVVRHGGTRTTYEPVDAVVDVGAAVLPGDLLGHLHPGGSHCSPRTCLHWGLIEDTPDGDRYRDPLTLVGGGPVRLLPWGGLGAAAAPRGPAAVAPSTPDTGAARSGARVGLAIGLP